MTPGRHILPGGPWREEGDGREAIGSSKIGGQQGSKQQAKGQRVKRKQGDRGRQAGRLQGRVPTAGGQPHGCGKHQVRIRVRRSLWHLLIDVLHSFQGKRGLGRGGGSVSAVVCVALALVCAARVHLLPGGGGATAASALSPAASPAILCYCPFIPTQPAFSKTTPPPAPSFPL